MFSERIVLDGTMNTRTLSNLVNKDGKSIKDNLLIRSDSLTGLSHSDQEKLKRNYNLKQIFDFRNSSEVELKPDNISGVTIHHLPVLSDEAIGITKKGNDKTDFLDFIKAIKEKEEPIGENKFMQNVYKKLVFSESANNAYKIFIHTLISTDGASLWHCSAGKDRAGFATIIILYILDFSMETIIQDYLGTNHYYLPKVNRLKSEFGDIYEDALWSVFGVDNKYLDVLFLEINNKYGSFDQYLEKALNVDDSLKKKLKKKYLL